MKSNKSLWKHATSNQFISMSSLHVRSVLLSIDSFSKLFFLSPFKSSSKFKVLPYWKSITFWNFWTLAGFFVYGSFHLIYVTQNDNVDSRSKLVQTFIDSYNKYCGLLLNGTLVLAGYFQQSNIANINLLFSEIEELFMRQMKIKIKNLNTLRFVYVQMIIIFGAVIYTEFTNCLMYIGPTSVNLDNFCMLLCIIPMLSSATVECRLFTYFLLMRERLNVINQSIDFYRNNLNSAWDKSSHNDNIDKMNGIKSKVFFIAELIGSNKINERVMTKTDNGRKSNCAAKLKSMTLSFWRFIKNLLNVRKHKIFVDNFDAAFKHPKNNFHPRNQNYMERVYSMQIIYSKLYEISDLISKAYGIQIIAIISVQFITLTTLLYYSTMKVIRVLSVELSAEEREDGMEEIWSSFLWIAIYMYKLYSICYCIQATNDEGMKVGHYLHKFGLHSRHLDEKFKIKMFLLQLLQQRIRFTPYGLFDIDLGLFSMITGAVITYILILIQFDIAQKA